MNEEKIKVVFLFGGQSSEHEVSLLSAQNVIMMTDKQKYNIIPIGIDKLGTWWLYENIDECFLNKGDIKKIKLSTLGQEVILRNNGDIFSLKKGKVLFRADVFFPVLHGTFGEDGTLQGMLQMTEIPFVGANALSSAICMDKEIAKRLLLQNNIKTAKFLTFYKYDKKNIDWQEVKQELGSPVFVKPANMGSSVGISKVKSRQEFAEAIQYAWHYDNKVIVEEFIDGEEIEISVLGNENPKCSVPGKLIIHSNFYSYEAKYVDSQATDLQIPAKLDEKLITKIQDLALQIYKTLGCEGMARVDFFVKSASKEIFVNEVNTIPGFTEISMYPKLWQVSGLSYSKLIDRLIELAQQRFIRDKSLTRF